MSGQVSAVKGTPTAKQPGYNCAHNAGAIHMKTVRIENADANSSMVRVTTQYRNSDNLWVDSLVDLPVVLGHPAAELTDQLSPRKRFIIEECT